MSRDFRGSSIASLCVVATCTLSACFATADRVRVKASEAQESARPDSASDPSSVVEVVSSGASTQTISFETNEGTWMSVDVSPDGQTFVFDLLGDIYLMSAEGGDARPLTSGHAWDQGPRFSPDGAYVYFVTDRVGYRNLWRVAIADQSLQQITRLDRDIMGAVTWSPDGSRLLVGIAGEDTFGDVLLHSIDPESGAITPVERWTGPRLRKSDEGSFETLRHRKKVFSGVGGSVGDSVFFSESYFFEVGEEGHQFRSWIYEVDPEKEIRQYLTPERANYSDFKPELSHNGNLLAYYRQYDDRRTELRVLNRQSGQDRVVRLLDDIDAADDAEFSPFDDSRPNYAFTPNDDALVFWHAGKIRRVRLSDGRFEVVPFRVIVERDVAVRAQPAPQRIEPVERANAIRWPNLSRDGKTLVFAAAGYIWLMDVPSGDIQRLTNADEFAFMPSISPDGSSVAYIGYASDRVPSSWQDYDASLHKPLGRLIVVSTDGQVSREILSSPNASFVLPEWSDDGTKIAVMRRSELGIAITYTVGWTNASVGEFNSVMTLPNRWTPFVGRAHYARDVSFDEAGENLLFSYPVSEEKSILATADLKGDGFRILAIGASDVGGITPSPDLKTLALTRRDATLWLLPFEVESEPTAVSTFTPDTAQLSENSGFFVDWYDNQRVSYGFGTKFNRYDLHTQALQGRHISLSIKRPMPDLPVAYRGARLVTLSEGVIEDGVLLVEHGRIKAIGSKGTVLMPEDTVVVNVAGKTIVPGFLDTHYHAAGFSGQAPNQYYNENTAIEYGVTTAWNASAMPLNDRSAAYVDLHVAGRVIGPRWSYSSSAAGRPDELIVNYDAALADVERSKDLGTAVMKEYYASTRSRQQWLSSAARHHQVGIVSHMDRFDVMMTRVVDGYTGGDHQFIPVPFYADVYLLLVHSGFIWTPDIHTTYGTLSPLQPFGVRAVTAYFCQALNEGKANDELAGDIKTASQCENFDADPAPAFDTHRAGRVALQAASAAGRGVNIGVSAHEAPAFNLHTGMWALWKGGMPIEDVLRATSLTNAEKLGLDNEIGSLEAGKVADFVVLAGNPMDNILNTMSIQYTIQGGVIYDADSAQRMTPADLQTRLAAEVAANEDPALLGRTGTDD